MDTRHDDPDLHDAQEVVNLWNHIVTAPIARVKRLTDDRRRKTRTRLLTWHARQTWVTVITWINAQPWCRGQGNGRYPGWIASFDWLIRNDGQVARCLERADQDQQRRASEPWTCPHDPPCGKTAYECHRNATLEEERRTRLG